MAQIRTAVAVPAAAALIQAVNLGTSIRVGAAPKGKKNYFILEAQSHCSPPLRAQLPVRGRQNVMQWRRARLGGRGVPGALEASPPSALAGPAPPPQGKGPGPTCRAGGAPAAAGPQTWLRHSADSNKHGRPDHTTVNAPSTQKSRRVCPGGYKAKRGTERKDKHRQTKKISLPMQDAGPRRFLSRGQSDLGRGSERTGATAPAAPALWHFSAVPGHRNRAPRGDGLLATPSGRRKTNVRPQHSSQTEDPSGVETGLLVGSLQQDESWRGQQCRQAAGPGAGGSGSAGSGRQGAPGPQRSSPGAQGRGLRCPTSASAAGR